MVEQPEPDCWMHPAVEVRPSPIQGLGLFAGTPIGAGTVVARLGGHLVSETELRQLFQRLSRVDTIAVARDQHLVLPPDSPIGKGNHSCDPNLWWTGAYVLSARRDIAAEEELTSDYATCTGLEDYALPCTCGSPLCRGTVTGRDWRLAYLRQRYGRHWVPMLLQRMAE